MKRKTLAVSLSAILAANAIRWIDATDYYQPFQWNRPGSDANGYYLGSRTC